MEAFIAAKMQTLIPHLFFVYPRLGLHISSRLASAVAAAANAASSLELSGISEISPALFEDTGGG
jgi:hypothetical protein